MASEKWFFTKLGQQQGPVTLDALQIMVRDGELRPDELVWTEGMADWAAAGTIQTLNMLMLNTPAGGNPATPPLGVISYYTPAQQFVPYAGFWRRFCAIFIDWIILAIPAMAMPFAIEHAIQQNSTIQSPGFAAFFGLSSDFVFLLCGWLYFALMESSSWQATLGKRLVGIIVIDETGARISFARATGRFFGKILSYIIFYIGFIMAGLTQKKQALHDILAGTLVIAKDP